MSNMRMKHKLIMSMMAGMIIIPGSVVRTQAAETDDSEKRLQELKTFWKHHIRQK